MASVTTITSRVKDARQETDNLRGLRAPRLLAKWPIIGFVMFIFGGLVFGALTYNLFAHGPLLQWDRALANTLPAIGLRSPAFVKYIMIAGFYVGKDVILVIDVLLSLYLLYKRYWRELTMVTVGGVGELLIFHFLSTFIARPRPPTQIWIIVNIPGFPSGHAISVVVCYGLLAYLLAPKMSSLFWKIVVSAAAVLIIGFVGFSRIFTGGHYLTDILAGYAVGIAWSGLAYTLIERVFQERRIRNVKEE
jgi:membrane-associated phospholipid phosphatase